MRIYDISQEVFESCVYPGDPSPKREIVASICRGDLYNLTSFSMCAHNGTHIDAPFHFLQEGKTIEDVPVEKFIGPCFVAQHSGEVSAEDARRILLRAGADSSRRILIKGEATVTLEAAEVFAAAEIYLLGNESQSVGPENAPMSVHKALLMAEIVLLEGIRLADVQEGAYFLSAAPLLLGGADGAPCRAFLIEF